MNKPSPRFPAAVLVMVSALLIVAGVRPGAAQLTNGRMYLSVGHVQLAMGKFNDHLNNLGMIEFDTGFTSLGGEFSTQLNERWSAGGDIHFLSDSKRRAGVYDAAVSGTYGGVNLGYLAHRWHGLNIRPELGVGVGTANLDISSISAGTSTSPLGDGRGIIEISSVQATVGLMLKMDYLWVMRSTADGTGYGLLLGTSIGFQLSPWQRSWESSGIDIFDDPGIKIQGPQIRFSAGFGWSRN